MIISFIMFQSFFPVLQGYYRWHCHTVDPSVLHGAVDRYVKLRVAHAPGMPGTFSPPPWVSDPDMHHGTCVTHVPWCITGSLTSGFLGNRWRGKRSRHSRRMRNPQFYASCKRAIEYRIRQFILPHNYVVNSSGWTHNKSVHIIVFDSTD